jgi:hypothetical protein
LHQLDFAGRDEDPRPFGVFQLQVLLGARFLVEQLQTAIAANAVGQMHHQVALAKLQEAVDRAARGTLHGASELVAVKQLRRADQNDA